MKVLMGAGVMALTVAVTVAAQGQGAPPAGAPQGRGGQAPKNLQVLPKDWTGQQVQAFMRTFTSGLGQQCTYCHVQDRSSDEKKEKLVARKMISMMMAINDQYLKDVGEPLPAAAPPAAGAPPAVPAMKVTCYTCHRGQLKPLTAAPPGGGTH